MTAPTSSGGDPDRLAELGARHLWMHFTRMGGVSAEDLPVITHGEGCYLYDQHGRRYLDGLAGLFTSQLGHGRIELAEAAAAQASRLGYFPVWGYAHEPAVELAARLAELTPGDLNRVFLTASGSEAVETAWKLARQYHALRGEPGRYKVISRHFAYHGTTMGALAITGLPGLKAPFEPGTPGAFHVPNTNRYRPWIEGLSDEEFARVTADQIERVIEMEGASTVAAVFLEPLQNAGGCFGPPPGYFERVREICDAHGVLLVSDEVICAYGRLGEMFGCQRYGYQPDIITSAKGLTSGYSPLGAVLVSDRIMEPFLAERTAFAHGITFGGHPVSCAVALANLEIFEREDVLGHVRRHAGDFEAMLRRVADACPIVGDVRGDGYFWAMELVTDRATKGEFGAEQAERLCRGFLSPRLFEEGLICRADDRGDPVMQFSPPLVAGPDELAMMEDVLTRVLGEAGERIDR